MVSLQKSMHNCNFVNLFNPLTVDCYFWVFQDTDVFQFEMDESQLSNVLSSIDDIEKKLTSYAQ